MSDVDFLSDAALARAEELARAATGTGPNAALARLAHLGYHAEPAGPARVLAWAAEIRRLRADLAAARATAAGLAERVAVAVVEVLGRRAEREG